MTNPVRRQLLASGAVRASTTPEPTERATVAHFNAIAARQHEMAGPKAHKAISILVRASRVRH